ncbi:hypothetical protein [Herbaspirillum hiltneri]|nr:hypothetical protein [Herbaspirillum hiltneri]
MTKKKIDNALYHHLKNAVSKALPLEYAIRATRQSRSVEFQKLLEIDLQIRKYWMRLGATEAEIDTEGFMDLAWDTVQIGFPLAHRHGRLYPPTMLDLINRGLAEVGGIFRDEALQWDVPAANYFRLSDLLHGNDMQYMLRAAALALKEARHYKPEDDVDLKFFAKEIRQPIHLHPGLRYAADEREENGRSVEQFGILLDTKMEFSLPDLKRQIREFIYQYAARRKSLRPAFAKDLTAERLLNDFFSTDLLDAEEDDEVQITRHDALMSGLAGLHCWDRWMLYQLQGHKFPAARAIKDTLDIYPKEAIPVMERAIRKNCKAAEEIINDTITRLEHRA